MTGSPPPSFSHQRLGLARLVAFAMPSLCVGALALAVPVYLPQYYAGHFKLGLAAVGAAFMAIRLLDTLFDVGIGMVMDRSRTRFGRYRVWMAAGAPLLMIAVWFLFTPPIAVSFAYLVVTLFLYYIGFSLVVLPHVSWASVLAGLYHERSRVFGVIQIVGVLGAVTVILLPIVLKRALLGSGIDDMALRAGFIIPAIALGVVLALMTTPERVVSDHAGETLRARDYWAMVARPDMRRIILADFCLAMGPLWMSAVYLFYFRNVRGFTTANASLLLLAYIAAGMAGAPILSWVAQRWGKHRTVMTAAAGYSLGLIGMGALPRGAFALVGVFMFAMGFLASSFVLLDRAMVADVGDAVRLETGKHRVGLLYAMISTTQKIAAGLSIGFSFGMLSLIGFHPEEGAHNTPGAIHGMALVYLIGPVVFVMLGAACYIGYDLDAKRHGDIRAQLDIRDAAASDALS